MEKLLNGRYQIIKDLSAGAFGQTYVAEDTWLRTNAQCVVKHIKPNSNNPRQREVCKRLFTSEAQTLRQLGKHNQIAQLLDSFEDEQGFYLVQELIVGEPLSAELPICRHCSKRWSEEQCVELLSEVLGILEFIHHYGVIHCDLKPNNLIKRASDGKLVLIDFGVAHQFDPSQVQQRVIPLQLHRVPKGICPVGYIPPEQFSGQPNPSSDLYALGMMAIEALTGISPAQLQTDHRTGEVNWQQYVSASDAIAHILNQMVRYDYKERYQSAAEAQKALRKLMFKGQELGILEEEFSERFVTYSPSAEQPLFTPLDDEELARCVNTVSRLVDSDAYQPPVFVDSDSEAVTDIPTSATQELAATSTEKYQDRRRIEKQSKPDELVRSGKPMLPLVLSGVGVGLATGNAVAISLGIHALIQNNPNPGLDLLIQAAQEYQSGNIDEAIALAKSIPNDSSLYQESVSAIKEWRQEWNKAANQFQAIEAAANEGRWRDVIEEARKTPDIAFWQQKIQPFVEQAKPQVEVEAQRLLQKAYKQAALKNFTGALAFLEQIPRETPTGAKIQPKLAEYTQKQQIKADYLLQKAYTLALKRDFSSALKHLYQIPQETPTYQKAQIKIAEYSQKQHFKEEVERQIKLTRIASEQEQRLLKPPTTQPSASSNPKKTPSKLDPGNQLQEVSPKPARATPVRR